LIGFEPPQYPQYPQYPNRHTNNQEGASDA
jgi:hypothetical protein